MMDIETRLTNLENLVHAFIKSQSKADNYTKYDIEGCRATDGEQSKKIDVNASDIADNRDGLMETFEGTMINAEDISALREGLEEVYEMIIESEV